jgi:hypothetical protein
MADQKLLYLHQKLSSAVEVLVTKSGKDRDKIMSAYIYHIHGLDRALFPESCIEKLDFINATLTSSGAQEQYGPSNRQGTIFWAVGYLSSEKISQIKRYIWCLYSDVTTALIGAAKQ